MFMFILIIYYNLKKKTEKINDIVNDKKKLYIPLFKCEMFSNKMYQIWTIFFYISD